MSRFVLMLSGLVSLLLGVFFSALPAAADEPPALVTRVLVNQRVELLPQGPLCLRVLTSTFAPGASNPPTGYHAHTLSVFYMLEGTQRLEYAAGPSVTYGPEAAGFSGKDNWHRHINVGTTPYKILIFNLICDDQVLPGATLLTGIERLAGIRPGPVPYTVNLIEASGVPGAQQQPPRITPGPVAQYVLEGELALSTAAGITRYRSGDLFVNPVGTPFQISVVSNSSAKWLVVQLFPTGAVNTLLPDLRLPSPFTAGTPAALPRTGDSLAWAGTVATLVGALLLAAGVGLRRAQA